MPQEDSMAKLKLKTKIKEAGSSIRLSGKYIQKMQRVSGSESEGETIVRHYQAYKYAKHSKYQCTNNNNQSLHSDFSKVSDVYRCSYKHKQKDFCRNP